MFGDYGKELLRSGIIEAKAGNRESARRYLDRAVYISNDHDVLAEAWFWMSEVDGRKAEKRKALENCLAHDLRHARARRSLAVLDGKLKADEIINPDKLPLAPEGLRAANAERFMCPKCGGRMSFAPDGQSLLCEYCSRNQRFSTAQPGSANEKDFIIAMATARGHGKPLDQQVFHCEGCGCEFILPPNQISSTCVYCGSPHVVNWESEEQLLAPDGIIPHAFDQTARDQIFDRMGGSRTGSNLKNRWICRAACIFRCGRLTWVGALIMWVKQWTPVRSNSMTASKRRSG